MFVLLGDFVGRPRDVTRAATEAPTDQVGTNGRCRKRFGIIGGMDDRLKAALLLLGSNTFMTVAWYGHLRFKNASVLLAIFVSWGIALVEYCLQVPANRIGYRVMSAYQLKILQEALTLVVFVVFAWLWLGEGFQVKYLVSFALILAAVVVAFR
jgi:uncharacterized protein